MSNSTNENWRPIGGYEGIYSVSDRGRVRSEKRVITDKNGYNRRIPELILVPEITNGGHQRVSLWKNHKKDIRKVHHLVLEAFAGERPSGMEACHWNDIPTDNRLANLRWATQSDNTFDRVRNGKHHEARKTHCKRGHEFTPENTLPQSKGQGRNCRKCRNLRDRARRRGIILDEYITKMGWGE